MEKYCESCGMPMGTDNSMYGLEKDGTKSGDYCMYCYKDGDFSAKVSMMEMIEICLQPMMKANPAMSEKKARELMNQHFPTLKRWK